MEQLTHFLYLFSALLLPLLLLKFKNRDDKVLQLPPGPWRLPVIGCLHHLLRNPLPHRAMADIARRLGDAPLIYLKLGEVPVVVASSPDAAREIMKTHDVTFATRPWTATIKVLMVDGEGLAFARYGALWRQLRKISILELLSARRVASFRGVREEEVSRLVSGVSAAATPAADDGEAAAVNVSERIAVLITDTAVRSMIGDRFERREEFLENLAEGIKITSGFNLGDLFPSSRLARLVGGNERRAAENHRRNFELMEYAIKQHEQQRVAMAAAAVDGAGEQEDLVDVLLRIQREGGLEVPLTMGMIKAVILYIKLIIKETLRLHPVVPLLLPRECRESCKVMGYDVPKGTTVFVNVWAINRDPKYWDDATTFKPERFEAGAVDFKGTDFEYTPFGAGRRMCPGMASAQAIMELVLASLLYHFDWELPGDRVPSELDMTEEMGITVRRKHDLYLRPVVRVPPHVAP
ncbi:unnamed protein product [Urochloa decumbens]|uniref:Cytochrome P450 n=1 Tax=Urochloa decumbens TaxID=240449 RepID=A0ABC8VGU5_9POAL